MATILSPGYFGLKETLYATKTYFAKFRYNRRILSENFEDTSEGFVEHATCKYFMQAYSRVKMKYTISCNFNGTIPWQHRHLSLHLYNGKNEWQKYFPQVLME